jgi:hypothetical protein
LKRFCFVTSKNRKAGRKAPGKAQKKVRRAGKKAKAQRRLAPKTQLPKKSPAAPATAADTSLSPKAPAQEGAGLKISVDRIEGETVIGDLIVAFPRTRGVLQKHGLRLDVEQAGDIYMTLEAFAALQGVKTETLVQELRDASKEPSPTQVPQLVTPPTT